MVKTCVGLRTAKMLGHGQTYNLGVPGGGWVDTSLQEKPVSVSHALQSLTSRENSLSVVALSVSQLVRGIFLQELKSNIRGLGVALFL